MYAPEIGRFLQPDPIGYDDGMNMYTYVGNNPANFVDPLGLCKDDDTLERRRQRLLDYIASAENAMLKNIETLNILHSEIESVHKYYKGVLIFDTAFSAATVPITVHKFFVAKGLGGAAKLATKVPFPDAVNTSVKLSLASRETLRAARVGAKLDAAKTAVSFLTVFHIGNARRNVISKRYDVPLNNILSNMESLSRGASSAYAELRSLGYE